MSGDILGDMKRVKELLAGAKPLPSLHCGLIVGMRLHAISEPDRPNPPGVLGDLTGIPIIVSNMPDNHWELRRGDEVIDSGDL